ncbi:unnamed protein product [Closterium sp. NIES-54]
MALSPSSVPQRVVLPEPPASSLPHVPDPESNLAHAASPTVTHLLATVVTDPDLDLSVLLLLYLVSHPCCFALRETRMQFTSLPRTLYAEAIAGEYPSQWQTAINVEMTSWKSTGTYIDEVPPPGANIVNGMWIFGVKPLPGSPTAFKARYVARGFSQRQGVDFFQTFSPTPKMTTLRVLLHVAAQRDYELHSLDFSIAFLQGSLHEEIWLRRTPGFTKSFPAGTQWSLRRPVYGLRHMPREWHDTLRTTVATLGFPPSSVEPSLFLRTETTLPPFYVLVYVDDLVFATADTEALALVKADMQERHSCTNLGPSALRLPVLLAIAHSSVYRPLALSSTFGQVRRAEWSVPRACGLPHVPDDVNTTRPRVPSQPSGSLRGSRTSGMGLVLGGQVSVVLIGQSDASWADNQATQHSSQDYTFSLGPGSVLWRSTRSSSVLGSSCEAEIYVGAMAAQEIRWVTYLLTDLGERPRSPPVLYVNKAMLALCHEQFIVHSFLHSDSDIGNSR